MPWKVVLEINRVLRDRRAAVHGDAPQLAAARAAVGLLALLARRVRGAAQRPHRVRAGARRGGPARAVVPMVDETSTRGMHRDPTPLAVSALARKVGPPRAELQLGPRAADVAQRQLPHASSGLEVSAPSSTGQSRRRATPTSKGTDASQHPTNRGPREAIGRMDNEPKLNDPRPREHRRNRARSGPLAGMVLGAAIVALALWIIGMLVDQHTPPSSTSSSRSSAAASAWGSSRSSRSPGRTGEMRDRQQRRPGRADAPIEGPRRRRGARARSGDHR